MTADVKQRLVNGTIIVIASFVLWSGGKSLHEAYFPEAHFATGIDLFHIPSGIRLLLLLIGGAAAATGIALANLFFTGRDLGVHGSAHIMLAAFYTAFVTLLSLWLTLLVLGVDRDLKVLAPRHLPWICLGTAVGSSLFHNAYFHAIAPGPPGTLFVNTLAMIVGDFLGSLVVVSLLWAGIWLSRRVL